MSTRWAFRTPLQLQTNWFQQRVNVWEHVHRGLPPSPSSSSNRAPETFSLPCHYLAIHSLAMCAVRTRGPSILGAARPNFGNQRYEHAANAGPLGGPPPSSKTESPTRSRERVGWDFEDPKIWRSRHASPNGRQASSQCTVHTSRGRRKTRPCELPHVCPYSAVCSEYCSV